METKRCLYQCVKHGGGFDKFKILTFALQLTFQALDQENNAIDTQLGIHIEILDSNDNPPIFKLEKYNINIKESALQGNFLWCYLI